MTRYVDTKWGEEVDSSKGSTTVEGYIDWLEDLQIMQMHDV